MADVRLIDANALRLMKVEECAGHTIEFAAGWKACVEYCKNDAPTIEAEPVNDGWISVKDRLPEIGEHYRSKLVMCYTPDGEHEYLFDYYEVNGFGQGCFTAEKYFGISITHWQYLPEPPKGE